MKALGLFSIGGAAIAAAFVLASCGSSSSSSSPPAPSGQDESCTRTSDCVAGLVCISNTCVPKGTTVMPDAGSMMTSEGGTTEAGTPPPPAKLGAACTTTASCNDPALTCVSTTLVGFQEGVCDLASFGITPTGKTCGECLQASDCCEIPTSVPQIFGVTDAGTSVQIRTCNDLLQLVIGGNTAVCPVSGSSFVIEACNLYAQYCDGCATNNSWACNAGQCTYTGSCIVGATSVAQYGSCPTTTRSGRNLSLRCVGGDAGTMGTCSAGVCATDPDCVGRTPTDSNFICEGTDCVCSGSACYFACASDLDCPGGYACDATSKVCKLTGCVPGASADAICKTQQSNAKAICKAVKGSGACVIPCAGDHDCSQFSGAITGTRLSPQQVCGPDNYCVSVAGNCSTDSDCKSTTTTTNGFCVTPPPASTVHSAISSH
jgi:hypothetical protein